jgi:hypothetical protein
MEERGGHSSGVETSAILLRLPTDLLARLDAYKAAVERETRFVLTRTTLLHRIVAAGLDALEQRPPAMLTAAPADAVAPTPAPTGAPQEPGRQPRPARRPRTASKPARKPPGR